LDINSFILANNYLQSRKETVEEVNRVLAVDYVTKDGEPCRYFIDVPRGVAYSDKSNRSGDVIPIRRVQQRMEYWNDDKKGWRKCPPEFNEVYDEYLRVRRIMNNIEIDEAIEGALLSDEEE
jgi:hypothetical protein